MRTVGNVIWLVFGGLTMGLGWWLAGLIACISIIGLPWAKSCFVLGTFAFWPFGREAVNRQWLTGNPDFSSGFWGTVGNVIWFIFLGWWLAIGHLLLALVCFVLIVPIPFGIQHLKIASLTLSPIGKIVLTRRELLQHWVS